MLEDVAKKLSDFTEKLRDLQHSIQRCEDWLASHDALGDSARDPILLERLKVMLNPSTSYNTNQH